MGWGHLKYLLLQNHWARIGHIYMKAFWYNVDSDLLSLGLSFKSTNVDTQSM
jgi:hypothetical protein